MENIDVYFRQNASNVVQRFFWDAEFIRNARQLMRPMVLNSIQIQNGRHTQDKKSNVFTNI